MDDRSQASVEDRSRRGDDAILGVPVWLQLVAIGAAGAVLLAHAEATQPEATDDLVTIQHGVGGVMAAYAFASGGWRWLVGD